VSATLCLLSPQTEAATHRPNYTPQVDVSGVTVTNPVFHGEPNLMMYTVTATADDTFDDERHDAAVGFTTTAPPARYPHACPSGATYAWSPTKRFSRSDTLSWTLYNFQPGTNYYYAIRTGSPGYYEYTCGALWTADAPTPKLPDALDELAGALTLEKSSGSNTKYVMFDTDDCDEHNHIVALDTTTGRIVWYLDLPAVTGIVDVKVGGWRYQPRGTNKRTTDRIVAALSVDSHRSYLYEMELDGTVLHHKNFDVFGSGGDGHLCDGSGPESVGPCPSHDAYQSDATGATYALVSGASGVGIGRNDTWSKPVCKERISAYQFLHDGVQAVDDNYGVLFTNYFMDDYGYNPALDPGPNAPAGCADSPAWIHSLDPSYLWIDWLHVNTVCGSYDEQYLDISMKQMDQVARIQADGGGTGSPHWTLAGDSSYSSFGALGIGGSVASGTATFASQHDVHEVAPGSILLLDNKGNASSPGTFASRALWIDFTEGATMSARIVKSWALVGNNPTVISPLQCPYKGSAELVPGDDDSVLALCHDEWVIEELNDPSGAETSPSLYIEVPPVDTCPLTGTDRLGIDGWYRAYPLGTIGDYP
jgi:hypothetical protein